MSIKHIRNIERTREERYEMRKREREREEKRCFFFPVLFVRETSYSCVHHVNASWWNLSVCTKPLWS